MKVKPGKLASQIEQKIHTQKQDGYVKIRAEFGYEYSQFLVIYEAKFSSPSDSTTVLDQRNTVSFITGFNRQLSIQNSAETSLHNIRCGALQK